MVMKRTTAPRILWPALGLRGIAAIVVVAGGASWAAMGSPAESSHVDTGRQTMLTLQAPMHFAVSVQDEDKTAFREDEAGFSAYYRVPKRTDSDDQSGGLPRLNVAVITENLLDNPEENNQARAASGSPLHLGSNFGIVELPMHPAVGVGKLVEPRNVTVYFDDRGWVVAYLPAGTPAAAIWRHDSGATDPKDNLKDNLLVLAINEVLGAGSIANPELSAINHDDDDHDDELGYYDWQNPECNAFLLFNNTATAGSSPPVNFVIPPAIANIQASAAVLITSRHTIDGDDVEAGIHLGRKQEPVVTADETTLLGVAEFNLARPTDQDGNHQTYLHKMFVRVSGNDAATGVIMLLYNKPGV